MLETFTESIVKQNQRLQGQIANQRQTIRDLTEQVEMLEADLGRARTDRNMALARLANAKLTAEQLAHSNVLLQNERDTMAAAYRALNERVNAL